MGKCRSFAYIYRWTKGYCVELEPPMASGWRRTRRCHYDEHVAHREGFDGGHYLGHGERSPWHRYYITPRLKAEDFIHDSQFLKFCLRELSQREGGVVSTEALGADTAQLL